MTKTVQRESPIRSASTNWSEDAPILRLSFVAFSSRPLRAMPKQIDRAAPRVDKTMGEQETDITINDLAAMLLVSRRSIERAIVDGSLVPSFLAPNSDRVCFTRMRADELKARADEAREKGHKRVFALALATGPILRPRQRPKKEISAHQWVQQMLWKRRMRKLK